jgi:hypothetical protein
MGLCGGGGCLACHWTLPCTAAQEAPATAAQRAGPSTAREARWPGKRQLINVLAGFIVCTLSLQRIAVYSLFTPLPLEGTQMLVLRGTIPQLKGVKKMVFIFNRIKKGGL